MSRLTASAFVAVLCAFASGCHGCSKAVEPTRLAIQNIPDPYDTVPARGQLSDQDRAIEVIDLVSQSLHYGSTPADVLRSNEGAPWRSLLVLMLADGDRPQVKSAWISLVEQMVGAKELPTEARLRARYAQRFVWDMEHTNPDDEVMKKAYLAEMAWCLEGIGSIHPADAGGR